MTADSTLYYAKIVAYLTVLCVQVLVFSRSLYLGGLSRMNAVHKHTDHTDGTAKGDYLDTW